MVLNGLGVTCLKTGENSLLGCDGVFEDDDSYALPLKKSGICRHFATAVSGESMVAFSSYCAWTLEDLQGIKEQNYPTRKPFHQYSNGVCIFLLCRLLDSMVLKPSTCFYKTRMIKCIRVSLQPVFSNSRWLPTLNFLSVQIINCTVPYSCQNIYKDTLLAIKKYPKSCWQRCNDKRCT